MSVTKLATTYLVCESEVQCYKVSYGTPNACIVWISLKTFFSSVSVSLADAKLLDLTSDSSIILHIMECCIRMLCYNTVLPSAHVRGGVVVLVVVLAILQCAEGFAS